jgi:hypothetical protein
VWPSPPCSVFGAICEGRYLGTFVAPVVILTQAAVHGWGAAIRVSPLVDPLIVFGPWTDTLGIADSPWMAGLPRSQSGAPCDTLYCHLLAMVLALHSASRHLPLASASVLIRSPCAVSIDSIQIMQHGSSLDPTAQDIALLFQAACLGLKLRPPLFIYTPAPQVGMVPQLSLLDLESTGRDAATPASP